MRIVFNPFTGNFDFILSTSSLDATYLRLDTTNDPLTADLEGKDFVKTRDGVVTYTDGKVSSVAKDGGRTLTIARNEYKLPSTINDGTKTWTFAYNADNTTIASWTIT